MMSFDELKQKLIDVKRIDRAEWRNLFLTLTLVILMSAIVIAVIVFAVKFVMKCRCKFDDFLLEDEEEDEEDEDDCGCEKSEEAED